MNFNPFKRKKQQEERDLQYVGNFSDALNFSSIYNNGSPLSLAAVYRCSELISDSIAMLPVHVYFDNEKVKHNLDFIFRDQSGNVMSFAQLLKLLIQSMLLRGNGFAYIERTDSGQVVGLRFLESGDVAVKYSKSKQELYYTINNTNIRGKVEPCNMLHFLKNSYNGVDGVSVLSYANRTVQTGLLTDISAKNFYESGCNLAGILKVQGQLTANQKNDIRASWQQAYSNGGRGLAVLQGNMDYQSVQVSAKDAQMLESRQYNVEDICRFFGVPSVLLGIGNSDLQQAETQFLTHTLTPILTLLEKELNRKLLLPSERSHYSIVIDSNEILRIQKQQQADYYTTLLQNGVLSINEVREQLGYSPIEDGDKHFIPYTDIQQNTINNNTDNQEQDENGQTQQG